MPCLAYAAVGIFEDMPQLVWSALLDPNRRRVLELLRQSPMPVGELVTALHLSQPATSKHLRVLREAGLVRVVQAAQRRIYELDPAPFAELDAWLAPYRELWNDRLDALGDHLNNTKDNSKDNSKDNTTKTKGTT